MHFLRTSRGADGGGGARGAGGVVEQRVGVGAEEVVDAQGPVRRNVRLRGRRGQRRRRRRRLLLLRRRRRGVG